MYNIPIGRTYRPTEDQPALMAEYRVRLNGSVTFLLWLAVSRSIDDKPPFSAYGWSDKAIDLWW